MTRFNTGNEIPSGSEEDFYDNSMALDEAMNSTDPTWIDRFGVEKPTIDAALKSAGFMPAGFDFVTGGTLQPGDRNKAVYNPAPNGDNNWYRWGGVFPKEIVANSQPNPKNENNWVPVLIKIGAVEREALRRTYQEVGLNLVPGSFEEGGVLNNQNDVLLQERTGKVFSGPSGTVAAGTNPASGGFVDRSAAIFRNEFLLQTIASLRDYAGSLLVIQLVGLKATYYRDTADTSSTDNGGTIIVDRLGRRWKVDRSGEIDVSRWGVIPDGVMDASVVLPYVQALGYGQVVRLPFVAGTSNVYYFSAFNPSATVGVKFVVDPGVSVSLPSDSIVGDPNSVSQYFSRDTKLVFRSLGGSDYVAGAKPFTPMAAIDCDASSVSAISPGAFFTPQKISWPNSDTFEPDTFAFSDANSALFQYAPGDGKFHVGSVRPRVGDRYSMPLPVSGGAFPCVLVQDQNGYSGVYFSADEASTCTVFRKNTGVPGTSKIVTYPMQGNHSSYSAINSEIQLHVVSATKYDVLINGFTIASITTQGPIDTIGFGAFFTATSGTFAVNLLYPTVIRKYEGVGSRFIALSVFGDSRSSYRMECWTEKAKKIADGSAGLRLWEIYNNAVAGQTSAQQLAVMQSVGVASGNIVVISIGTNDAQGQVGVSTYKANLEAMCDICIAAGKPFIVVKPPLWYTQAQSGGKGQPSANYQLTSQYRAICALVCANKGGKLVDIDAELGPIVSYYVNQSAAIDMVGKGDPVVFDNIHFTGTANDIMATAIIKAVMGIIAHESKAKYHTDWLTVKALNSWLINTGDNPLQISATMDGAVSLTGCVFKSSGAIVDGTAIAKLPQILAPRFYTEWMIRGDAANSKVSIDTNGVVKIYGMSTNNYVSLSGCSWSV